MAKSVSEALSSADSGKEMLDLFEKLQLEPSLEEEELGLGLLQVSQKLDSEDHDPEKVFSLAERALNIFLDFQRRGITIPSPVGWVSPVVCALSVLSSSSYKLKKYDETLKYLKWADRNLKRLEGDGGYDPDEFLHCMHTVQLLFSRVNGAMGRLDECVVHLRKLLEVTEKITEEGSLAIGDVCMGVCQAYVKAVKYHEALPFGLKALDICVKHLGSDSVEVAMIRIRLGRIYTALGNFEEDNGLTKKALRQTQLASRILESVGRDYETLELDFERANNLIQLGRYEEAIGVLKVLVSRFSTYKVGGFSLGGALISMATAYCSQGKFEEARDTMETAEKTIEMEEIEPYIMAFMLGDMAVLHEKMNDIGTAIALYMRVLALPGLHEKFLVDTSERLFALLLAPGMREQAIQHLEEAVERLKQSLGPEHSVVGKGYTKLAIVASGLDMPLHALKYIENAKSILDASLGPQDPFSLRTSQMLSMFSASEGRHAQAIECQEKVVEGFKELGPSHRWEVHTASLVLNLLKGEGC